MTKLVAKNIAPASPSQPAGAAVSPPVLRPEDFEEYPAFRETFLVYFPDAQANATMRGLGKLLHEMVLEFWGYWPPHREGIFRAELRAAVADLRHVQGCLTEWTGEALPREDPREIHLADKGAEVARKIGELADLLERELDTWQGEGN